MKRRLLIVNIVLALAWVALSALLYQRWRAGEARNAEILRRAASGPAAQAIELKKEAEAPVRAASYFEVAEKMLFSRDRNPTVIVEAAAPAKKEMPPLPNAFGVMDLGDGPVAFLALKGEPQRGMRVGETIGEFKLVAADAETLTFEWDGERITRKLDDLRGVAVELTPAAAAAPAAPSAPGAPAAPTVTGREGAPKFGDDMSATTKYCAPDDPSPEGTVHDGYRKVIRQTPFSKACFWEKVQ
jgi:hypothetical protein